MPQTVASHQVAAFTTPINGATTDANVVRGNDNTLRTGYVNHDADPGIHLQSSTLASRPAFGAAGRKWLTADTGSYRLFFDTGSAWQELTYLRTDAGGTVLAQTTFSVTGNPQILSTDGTVTQFVGYADTNVAYSGTQTNHAYALLTNNVERVRVLNGGNVGIGTATPSALLHVAGTFLATGAATFDGNVTLGNASSDQIVLTGQITGAVLFAMDNANDIGSTIANRPRTIHAGTSVVAPTGTFTTVGGADANYATFIATTRFVGPAGSISDAAYTTTGDFNTGVFFPAADTLGLTAVGREQLRVAEPSAGGQTGLFVYDADNNALERVTVGAADSGGTGFKVLRIPN